MLTVAFQLIKFDKLFVLQETVSLKFMLSYTMDDETFTEMGEVEKLPLI